MDSPLDLTQKLHEALKGPIVVLDTETTGLDPKNDRVISFGAVYIDKGQIQQKFEWFFNPGNVNISPEAMQVHGITPEFLSDKPLIKAHLPSILGLVHGAFLCAHNAKFDFDFLDEELRRNGFPTLRSVMSGDIDTMHLSKDRFPGKAASLDALCDRLNISRKHRVAHGALLDAELCAQALLAMGRTQFSMRLDVAESTKQQAQSNEPIPELIVLLATDEEVAEHDAYMRELQKENKADPIWLQLEQPAVEDSEEEVSSPAIA